MKKNIKSVIAAVLAAACLSGCAAKYEPYSAPTVSSRDFDLGGALTANEDGSSDTSVGLSSGNTVSSEPAANSSVPPAPSSSSSSSESKPSGVVATVSWNDKNNNSKSDDDKSIGYKTPPTETEKLVDALIDELDLKNNKKSDMEKLCILAKWFCDNTEYDYELVGTADAIYNAGKVLSTEEEVNYLLTKHGGICTSYAKAACLILSECGIDTLYCKSNSANHAWNAVKIDGKWTYTDFVGGPKTLILGSSRHGLPKDTFIHWCTTLNRGYSGARPDVSEVSTELRLFDFNGKELEVHKETDGYSYVDSSGKRWKTTF